MRFLVMVFLSLFLMTNVSVAADSIDAYAVDCPKLKREIQMFYDGEVTFGKIAKMYRKEGNNKQAIANEKLADDFLNKAAKYAMVYTALCK